MLNDLLVWVTKASLMVSIAGLSVFTVCIAIAAIYHLFHLEL